MKVRARWEGPPPSVGDFLRSRVRPRCAYLITSVVVNEGKPLALEVERVPLGSVFDGATVHPWRWDPRGRKRRP